MGFSQGFPYFVKGVHMYNGYGIMSLQFDVKLMSHDKMFLLHDKNVDLTGVSACCQTLFKCLRRNPVGLRQNYMM